MLQVLPTILENSSIVALISDLMCKNTSFVWFSKHEEAARKLKKLLANQPVLAIYDPEAETELHTNTPCKRGFHNITSENRQTHAVAERLDKYENGNVTHISLPVLIASVPMKQKMSMINW